MEGGEPAHEEVLETELSDLNETGGSGGDTDVVGAEQEDEAGQSTGCSSGEDDQAGAEDEGGDRGEGCKRIGTPGTDLARPAASPQQQQRAANVRALLEGGECLAVTRAPLMAALRVTDADQLLRRPFKSPHPNAPPVSEVVGCCNGARANVRSTEQAEAASGWLHGTCAAGSVSA
jgi:hypothetical protein